MELVFTCPSCGVQMQIEAAYAGQHAQCPQCEADISIPPLNIGPNVILGGFRLEKKLGSGSMGDVYLAEQITMKRKVAVKILPASMTRDPQAVERFLHEVQTLARFEHPNIVSAFNAGEDDGTYYLAMAYVNGEDLDSIVKRQGVMAERRALEIIRKVSIALQFAWQEHQLLHRDIKPENVMIDTHGEIRLMDMGISKSAHEDSNLTMPGVVFGTPHYMSPEQAWSDGPIDFRADLYSLGASFYRLVTGEPPYTGSSQTVFAKLAKPDPFPMPRELRPDLSEACDHLIHVMMAPKPEQRYDSWDACIADIDRVLAGELPSMPRPPMEGAAAQAAKSVIDRVPGSSQNEQTSGLTGTGMQIIQPKGDKGRQKPKLSLSRTEQIKAPPLDGGGEPEEEPANGASKLSLRGNKPAKKEMQIPPKPEAEKPRGATLAEWKRRLPVIAMRTGKITGMVAAVVLFLGGCWLGYLLINGEPMPWTEREEAAPEPIQQVSTPPVAKPPPPPTTVVRSKVPQTTETPPLPADKTEPTREEIEEMIREEYEKRAAAVKVDEQKIAQRLKLRYPVPPPTMSSKELVELVAKQAVQEADKRFPLKEKEREFKQEAEERYGAFKPGQQVNLPLRGGVGIHAQASGTLRDIGVTSIRVGDREISVQDLAEVDRERLDPATAAKNVQNYVDFKMRQLRRDHEDFVARFKQKFIPEAHARDGYLLHGSRYIAASELLKQEVEKARAAQLEKLRAQLEAQYYTKYNYTNLNGLWVKAAPASGG